MRDIKESDWKRLRDVKPIVLDRFCERVFADIGHVRSNTAKSSHERYLEMYNLVQERDRELGNMFDRLSRSSAFGKLVLMHRAGLLSADELAAFSEDIRSALARSADL